MKLNDLFPSNYLKATDVGDEDLILTINEVKMETLGQGKEAEDKPVVYFGEIEKGLVLNKTNAEAISRLYGDDTEAWEGKQIALFATEVDFRGTQTLALRVRLRAPKASRAASERPMVGAASGGKKPNWEDAA